MVMVKICTAYIFCTETDQTRVIPYRHRSATTSGSKGGTWSFGAGIGRGKQERLYVRRKNISPQHLLEITRLCLKVEKLSLLSSLLLALLQANSVQHVSLHRRIYPFRISSTLVKRRKFYQFFRFVAVFQNVKL